MLIKCNAADHLYLIEDDPVRGEMLKDNTKRFEDPFHVYAEVNDATGEIAAVVCVVVCRFVPQDEAQLKFIAAGKLTAIDEALEELKNKVKQRINEDNSNIGHPQST